MEKVGGHGARPAARHCGFSGSAACSRPYVYHRAALHRRPLHGGERMTQLFCVTAVLLCATLTAGAQPAGQLQQQLQELKQQYAETTRALEQRIAALEQQIAATPKEGTVSAADLAKEVADKSVLSHSNGVGAKFQGSVASEPTYELLRDADQKIAKLEQQMGSFEFHGYFRSGYGQNSAGGQQVAFQAPGAGAEYRLGNEAETYGEFIFVNNWLNPDHATDKAPMKTEGMLEAKTTNSASYARFPRNAGNDHFLIP